MEEDNERYKNLEAAAEVVFDLFFEVESLEHQWQFNTWADAMTKAVMEMGEYLRVKKIGDE